MKKDPKIFLQNILNSIEEIEKSTKNLSPKEFFAATIIQDAVIRRLEIVGEATKNLPQSFCSKHPSVKWKRLAGLRDVLIHDYFGVDIGLVWRVVKQDVPELKTEITALLQKG